jgi:ArsR family transcriptional regulator, arsenate/arsenite/antimonite-responsive transcriptional repressor
MTNDDAVVNLFALAHPGRLNVFRTIVKAGPNGIAAGKIAEGVGIPANTASTHLSILTGAGLLTAYRDGRSIIYRANFAHFSELVGFMIEECCEGHPDAALALNAYFKKNGDEPAAKAIKAK